MGGIIYEKDCLFFVLMLLIGVSSLIAFAVWTY